MSANAVCPSEIANRSDSDMKLREGCMGTEVCTALNILNFDFRVMTPCSAAGGYQYIGRTAESVFRKEGKREEGGKPW